MRRTVAAAYWLLLVTSIVIGGLRPEARGADGVNAEVGDTAKTTDGAVPDSPGSDAPTLPTAPKEPPPVKDHVEFESDMDDVLERYREDAEQGAELVTKAEREAPLGNVQELAVPVPKAESLRLVRDAEERFHQYRLRDVDSYLAHTRDPEPAKVAGEEFLRAYSANAINRPHTASMNQLLELGQKALDAGSGDPLVRTCNALLKIGHSASPDAIEADLLPLANELAQTPYPQGTRVVARAWLCKFANVLGHPSPERISLLGTALVDWLAAEKADPQWRDCVFKRYQHAISLLTPAEQEAVLGACLKAGTGDPWLLHYELGNYYLELGWHYRTRARANKVTPEGRARLEENLPLSSLHFRYAWALDPTLPHAPRRMIFVSGAGFDPSANQYDWFVRATAARFDDFDSYKMALEFLSWRWGVGEEARWMFAEQCLATERFDTLVPFAAISAISTIWPKGTDTDEGARSRELITEYLEKRRAAQEAQPDQTLAVDAPEPRSDLAYRMFRLEMLEEEAAELRALGPEKVHVRSFQLAGALGEYLIDMEMAKASIGEEDTLKIYNVVRAPWTTPSTPKSLQIVRPLLERHTPEVTDDFSRRFLQQAERVCDQQELRAAGVWVDLRFDEKLLGWESYADDWMIDTDANLMRLWKHDGEAPQLHLRSIADFRQHLEIELELEVLEPYPYPRAVGIHWAPMMFLASEWDPKQPLFGVESRLEAAESGTVRRDYAVLPAQAEQLEYAPLPTTGRHKLHLRIWKEVYEFELDGFRWLRPLIAPIAPEMQLGIGEAWPEHFEPRLMERGGIYTGGGFQVSNVRLRKMTGDPPVVK
jgi:hypothetical protein